MILFRTDAGPCTLGVLFVGSKFFYTLEPPWKDNERNVSCIPAGEYPLRYLPRSASGKYRDVYHLLNVSGRAGILIHNGNTVNHTKGCILLGKRRGMLNGQPAVLNSRTAMAEFITATERQPAVIEVI